MKRIVLLLALVFAMPSPALGFGEIFRIETSGTEYCGDFLSRKFNARNNVNLWVLILDENEIVVSFTPDFGAGTFFSMFGRTYVVRGGATPSASFVAATLFEDGSSASIRGAAKLRQTGEIKSLAGTFIEDGVVSEGCFSSGTFTSVQRVFPN